MLSIKIVHCLDWYNKAVFIAFYLEIYLTSFQSCFVFDMAEIMFIFCKQYIGEKTSKMFFIYYMYEIDD